MLEITYRNFLEDEFKNRLEKNAAYSLRAFARDLGLSNTHLTDVLRNRNHLSEHLAAQVADKLPLQSVQRDLFLDLVTVESVGNEPAKLRAQKRLDVHFMEFQQLSEERFHPISDWYYLPLMELLTLKLESYEAKDLGKRLGLSEKKTEAALKKLLNHKLISRDGEKYRITNNETTNEIPSQTIRNYYRQTLALATDAIEEQEISRRDFSAVTFALSKDKIQWAKERIRQFRRELALELNQGENKDAVYTLSISLFENTKDVQ